MLANHQSWKLCYSPSTSKKTTQVSQNWLGELKTTILKLKKKQSSVLKQKHKKKILACFKNKTKSQKQLQATLSLLFRPTMQQPEVFWKKLRNKQLKQSKKKLMNHSHLLFCFQNKTLEKEKTKIPNSAQIILVSLIVCNLFFTKIKKNTPLKASQACILWELMVTFFDLKGTT